jgi:uncharacterized protein
MDCRAGCGACCIAPSISSPIPGMANGKPAGTRCIHLTDDYLCAIFTSSERPRVCNSFRAEKLICGDCREEAISIMQELGNG